jgi:hypothetical protein
MTDYVDDPSVRIELVNALSGARMDAAHGIAGAAVSPCGQVGHVFE